MHEKLLRQNANDRVCRWDQRAKHHYPEKALHEKRRRNWSKPISQEITPIAKGKSITTRKPL
jgi:hypothetical protein